MHTRVSRMTTLAFHILYRRAIFKHILGKFFTNGPVHEISNNVVCATNKISDQPDQSLYSSLEYSMSVKLLTKHLLEVLSLKGGCTCSSESTLVKVPHCWKSRVTAQMIEKIRKWDRHVLLIQVGTSSVRWTCLVFVFLNYFVWTILFVVFFGLIGKT